MKIQRVRNIEKLKYRESETERNEKTESQKHRELKNRESETQSNENTESQKHGEMTKQRVRNIEK